MVCWLGHLLLCALTLGLLLVPNTEPAASLLGTGGRAEVAGGWPALDPKMALESIKSLWYGCVRYNLISSFPFSPPYRPSSANPLFLLYLLPLFTVPNCHFIPIHVSFTMYYILIACIDAVLFQHHG